MLDAQTKRYLDAIAASWCAIWILVGIAVAQEVRGLRSLSDSVEVAGTSRRLQRSRGTRVALREARRRARAARARTSTTSRSCSASAWPPSRSSPFSSLTR
jgi:hypothetical protein